MSLINNPVIALAGNPNVGKTTLFNALTGSRQTVGNWPGVTVEHKSGNISHKDSKYEIVDLPGIYSLSGGTPDELVARNFILNNKPDLIINIVDASNLERNLYLTIQLMELGAPILMC
ncbi:MAG TPA: ferrous iron transport protein B, partial [Candidatus Cloacimonas sp.]|nr:ferrous iron transport protein B [Candidatus Cloacimonas sp.]